MNTTNRTPNLDIIRSIGLIFVVSVHFFLNIGFYDTPVVGIPMSVMVYLRTLFMTCVPIFLVLSGYLLTHKKVSGSYYRRIVKIYLTYAMAGALCVLFERFVNQKSYGISSLVLMLLSFEDSMYFWYINMYLGLFLLAPFLNGMYHSIENPGHKKILIFSLLFMTALPGLVNSHQITHPSWWLNPTSSQAYHQLIPDWWAGIYPVTYYILGSYLRENPLKCSQPRKLGMLIAALLVAGTYNLYRSYSVPFQWSTWSNHESIFTVALTVLLFSLIQGMDLSRMGPRTAELFQRISRLSLAAYLVSYIPDHYFYPLLMQYQPSTERLLFYFPLMVPLVLVCSLLLAAPAEWLAGILSPWVLRIWDALWNRLTGRTKG